MQPAPTTPEFVRPFPALTPEQRYPLDVFGYVVVPDVLSREECDVLREALQQVKRDLLAAKERGETTLASGAHLGVALPFHVSIGSILQTDPAITAYATHPGIVGLAEELIGGEARLVEFNAHINSRNPHETFDKEPLFGFHRGMDVPYGSHLKNNLYHCKFVKTLTNLTDLGPDDGGTVVIVGSHRSDLPVPEVIDCAYANRSLIHQVIAPAGSTLLFNETLIHATGQVRSDNERAIIIGGFGAAMLPWWDGSELREDFKSQVPAHLQTLMFGKAHWEREPRYRTLADAVDNRKFTLQDGWWPHLS